MSLVMNICVRLCAACAMFPIAISGSTGHALDECPNMLSLAASNSRSKKVKLALFGLLVRRINPQSRESDTTQSPLNSRYYPLFARFCDSSHNRCLCKYSGIPNLKKGQSPAFPVIFAIATPLGVKNSPPVLGGVAATSADGVVSRVNA